MTAVLAPKHAMRFIDLLENNKMNQTSCYLTLHHTRNKPHPTAVPEGLLQLAFPRGASAALAYRRSGARSLLMKYTRH
jgi:hypothetical protein